MNWFSSKPTDAEAAEDQKLIEAGGLPRSASHRLTELGGRIGTPEHLFTSNMSVNEFLLTRECGYEPIVQVMGTSVYHVGWQMMTGNSFFIDPYTGRLNSHEVATLTQAYQEARHLAFGRLLQEAELVHADGVVGVRFERVGQNLPSGVFEFKAIGTAVRQIGAPPVAAGHKPFLSNLSGQDHWALRKGGYKPIGFVFGNCSWYQISGYRNQSLNQGFGSWRNGEYPDFTEAVSNARELASQRFTQDAESMGAEGVVGVVVDPHIEKMDVDLGNNSQRVDMFVQFTIFGTAIAKDSHAQTLKSVGSTVTLRD